MSAIIRLSNNCGEYGDYWISAPGNCTGRYISSKMTLDISTIQNDAFSYKEGVPFISFGNFNR